MKKRYWLNRLKPSSYLLSDYANRARLEERYVQPSGLTFIDPVDFEEVETEVVESSVNVQVDCCVSLGGVQCGVEAGFVKVISGNEPTEPLKNIKKAIHARFVPSVPVLSHDPKYGGWVDPFEFRSKPKKREKDYEYY